MLRPTRDQSMPGEIDEKQISKGEFEALDKPSQDDIASQKRYQKLLDDVLYAIAIFYSKQMSDFLEICGQPVVFFCAFNLCLCGAS